MRDWSSLLSEYNRSDMSASAFARSKKIATSAFFYHLHKSKKSAKGKSKKAHANGHANGHMKNGFIDLTATPMIEIETKAGTIVRLPQSIDAQKLKEIVEALQ